MPDVYIPEAFEIMPQKGFIYSELVLKVQRIVLMIN